MSARPLQHTEAASKARMGPHRGRNTETLAKPIASGVLQTEAR